MAAFAKPRPISKGRAFPSQSISVSETLWPIRRSGLDYPILLDFPAPQVRSYPPATVIAEKFQAMVALGVLNERMKDYYDLWAIPRAMDISAEDLDAAISATFERRRTLIPKERPPGLSVEMFGDEGKQRQWRAYAASLELETVSLESIIEGVWELVGPSCTRIVARNENET
nr:nucleotidyl transferase AbiEii/AbiGii toxin family protein [Phyllobacterium bourgognense]